MILHPPFMISARLAPCLDLGCGAKLSLVTTTRGAPEPPFGGRLRYGFVIDFEDGTEYWDDKLQSGCGFGGVVDGFNGFLSFLLAAVESYEFEQRNPGSIGENTDLFPLHIVQWASENKMAIECVQCDICNPEDGSPNDGLIVEQG